MTIIEPDERDIQMVLKVFSTGAPTELEREYFIDVLRCAGNSINKELSNSDIKHAALLLKLLFDRATEIVKIHTGSLFNDVYGIPPVISAARALVQRGGKIFIAYSNHEEIETMQQDRVFLKNLRDLIDEKKINVWDASHIDQISEINHFAVQDNSAYRFEKDMVKMKASANFGDTASAQKLSNVFDLIQAKSVPVLGF